MDALRGSGRVGVRELPVGHHERAVGPGRHARVMRDYDDGGSEIPLKLKQRVQHQVAVLCIQGSGGLVAQE